MLIGYARVSTDDQNLYLQTDALTQVGRDRIFENHGGRGKADHPGHREAIELARFGDTVIVWRLDRLIPNRRF